MISATTGETNGTYFAGDFGSMRSEYLSDEGAPGMARQVRQVRKRNSCGIIVQSFISFGFFTFFFVHGTWLVWFWARLWFWDGLYNPDWNCIFLWADNAVHYTHHYWFPGCWYWDHLACPWTLVPIWLALWLMLWVQSWFFAWYLEEKIVKESRAAMVYGYNYSASGWGGGAGAYAIGGSAGVANTGVKRPANCAVQ